MVEIMVITRSDYDPAQSSIVISSTVISWMGSNEAALHSFDNRTLLHVLGQGLAISSYEFIDEVAALSSLGVKGSVEAATPSADRGRYKPLMHMTLYSVDPIP